jgi:putative proteasome-type protease
MQNPYFRMLHSGWGQKLREVFDSLEDPVWDDSHTDTPLRKITRPEEKLI